VSDAAHRAAQYPERAPGSHAAEMRDAIERSAMLKITQSYEHMAEIVDRAINESKRRWPH
jgi:hypothetical protein